MAKLDAVKTYHIRSITDPEVKLTIKADEVIDDPEISPYTFFKLAGKVVAKQVNITYHSEEE